MKIGDYRPRTKLKTIAEWMLRMTYNELTKEVEDLSYRDKFRLAQLLIQLARKEEEEHNPQKRQASTELARLEPELVLYVAERLRKLKPSKKEAVFNSIGAMFQFQGGISDTDKEKLLAELVKKRHIVVADNGRVTYPEVQQIQARDERKVRV